jgi:hypothetical protein
VLKLISPTGNLVGFRESKRLIMLEEIVADLARRTL